MFFFGRNMSKSFTNRLTIMAKSLQKFETTFSLKHSVCPDDLMIHSGVACKSRTNEYRSQRKKMPLLQNVHLEGKGTALSLFCNGRPVDCCQQASTGSLLSRVRDVAAFNNTVPVSRQHLRLHNNDSGAVPFLSFLHSAEAAFSFSANDNFIRLFSICTQHRCGSSGHQDIHCVSKEM